MLSATPNLVECRLDEIYFEPKSNPASSRVVTHSSLKYLHLGGYHNGDSLTSSSSAYILQYLTLPPLKRLTVSDCYIDFEDFCAFLDRSSSPLQSMRAMLFTTRVSPAFDGNRFLQLISGVTDLDLTYGIRENLIFSVLAAIGSQLPSLRNLTIRGRQLSSVRQPYELVLSAVAARRTSPLPFIHSFKSLWEDDWGLKPENEPSADTIEAMRKLEADGMEIHIGTEERNLI